MKVLLLDQDRSTAAALSPVLGNGGLTAVHSQSEGLRRVAEGGWDLILLDASFSDAGLELLSRFQTHSSAPVVLLTGEPSMQLTLAAIQRGAHDVLPKPVPPSRLREILGQLALTPHLRPLSEEPLPGDVIVGASPEMLSVYKSVARAAASEATVLVLGESGTGKEMVARVLHGQSPRAGGPFIAINCAAIPENLLESELFGHEKGAFTGAIGRRVGRFERASGGTLFLDEIGDMSLALQSKILRALQEREIERVGGTATVPVNVRVVAATNRDLASAVKDGGFREDLFYRLAVVSIRLPPLRTRGEDLFLLTDHFAALYAREYQRPIRAVAEETLDILRAHPWPGNVRQLRNAIERAVVMADGEVLLPQHLPADILAGEDAPGRAEAAQTPICTLQEMEQRLIQRALQETDRNLTAAADLLGIHRNTLRRKIAEYGLEA